MMIHWLLCLTSSVFRLRSAKSQGFANQLLLLLLLLILLLQCYCYCYLTRSAFRLRSPKSQPFVNELLLLIDVGLLSVLLFLQGFFQFLLFLSHLSFHGSGTAQQVIVWPIQNILFGLEAKQNISLRPLWCVLTSLVCFDLFGVFWPLWCVLASLVCSDLFGVFWQPSLMLQLIRFCPRSRKKTQNLNDTFRTCETQFTKMRNIKILRTQKKKEMLKCVS